MKQTIRNTFKHKSLAFLALGAFSLAFNAPVHAGAGTTLLKALEKGGPEAMEKIATHLGTLFSSSGGADKQAVEQLMTFFRGIADKGILKGEYASSNKELMAALKKLEGKDLEKLSQADVVDIVNAANRSRGLVASTTYTGVEPLTVKACTNKALKDAGLSAIPVVISDSEKSILKALPKNVDGFFASRARIKIGSGERESTIEILGIKDGSFKNMHPLDKAEFARLLRNVGELDAGERGRFEALLKFTSRKAPNGDLESDFIDSGLLSLVSKEGWEGDDGGSLIRTLEKIEKQYPNDVDSRYIALGRELELIAGQDADKLDRLARLKANCFCKLFGTCKI